MDNHAEPESQGAFQTITIGVSTRTEAVQMTDIPRGTSLGRYVVLGKLGAGGMGVVYSAYDPELDRKVALKLLQVRATEQSATDSASAQLIREAKAMARLSHPNVVPVYDVGACEGQLFLTMELVEGSTLKEWLAERPRPWREVVATFKEAGRGLAAAHAVGVVHRDFKPANVLMGKDGRPRVTDFGLARATQSAEQAAPTDRPSASDVLEQMRAEGLGVAGTPAYMAPEQYQGEPGDERTDQYGFCAALYEGLYGVPPFHGSLREIAAQVFSDKAPQPGKTRGVPAWVRRIVLRGLSKDPAARYGSMQALLADLGRDRSAERRRWAAAGGIVLVVAGALYGYRATVQRERLVCKGAERKLAGVWDEPRRQAVGAALKATGKSYAEDTWSRVKTTLDAYALEWVGMHVEACEATRVRGEQSEEVLSLRVMCLDDRLKELRALADLFSQADEQVIEKATQAAHALTSVKTCADTQALLAPVKPPKDESTRAQVEAVRATLAETKALRDAGKYAQGRDKAEGAVSRAHAIGYAPLEAEALLLFGSLRDEAGDSKAAQQPLKQAVWTAEAGRHDKILAKAATALVYVVGYKLARFGDGADWSELARAALLRLGGDDETEIQIEQYLGSVLNAADRYDEARKHAEHALSLAVSKLGAESEAAAAAHNNLGFILSNLGRHEEAISHYKQAVAIHEQVVGPDHPAVGWALYNLAVPTELLGRHEEALGYCRRALAIAEKALGPEHPDTEDALLNTGAVLMSLGRYDESLVYAKRALAVSEKIFGPVHVRVANALSNIGICLREKGQFEEAQRHFARALEVFEKTKGPNHPYLAYALTGMGRTYLKMGLPGRSLAVLERSLKLSEAQSADAFVRAETRFALAQALVETGASHDRARRLAQQALDHYAHAGPESKKDAAEVEEWLMRHGPRAGGGSERPKGE